MTPTPKPNLPIPPPYKFNQLPEDHRSVLNCIFDKYIETSCLAIGLGLTKHEAHKVIVDLFDSGVLRVVADKGTANGSIHPEARLGLELWNCTAKTFTLI